MSVAQAVKVPVITYHSIDESGSVISTSPEKFRRQMKLLSETGFKVISLKELTTYLHENRRLQPKTVALTFDDGFQNFYSEAFPILQEHRFTATVFLVTDYCDKYNDWPGNIPLERSKLLSWNEIKELSKYEIEFGAHTLTHPDLTRIPMDQATREIVESKLTIEDHLGIEVTDFAYPYGKYNSEVKHITKKHYRSACSTNLGKVRNGNDPFSLKRLDSYYLASDYIFNSIPSVSLDWYMIFRQAMRNLKQVLYH